MVKKVAAGKKSSMPAAISPMLCTLTKEVVTREDYIYEIKWDGYRLISYCNKSAVRMDSRGGLDYTGRYPTVVSAIKKLGHDIVLDGEVVVFDKNGSPDFDAVQLYNGKTTPITYCIFDVLWLDGSNLMSLPLVERKAILKNVLGKSDNLLYSESFDDGEALYQQMLDKNLEGIVAKKKNSEYVPGQRDNNWLKTPTRKRQEFVIGGWAESLNGRAFKSLLFGAYEGNELRWIGRSGGGYKEKEMPGILKQLHALETNKSPFANPVLDTKGAVTHWVKPTLVANFEFAAWTRSGRIRKPATFLGFRKDKKPSQVVREVPAVVIETTVDEPIVPKKKLPASRSHWVAVEQQNMDDKTQFDLGDCTIDLWNVARELWKGITKADLITYYHQVSPYLLAYIKDRPQSLLVKINGPHAPGFYIKDMEGREPDCAQVFKDKRRHKSKGKPEVINYLVANNEPTLLWMINLGCIDVNPWNSRVSSPEEPDFIVIDLDPSEEQRTAKGLKRLADTAMAAKQFCDDHQLKAFVKTSGQTGIHFLLPCSGLTYQQGRAIAERISRGIHALVPDASTMANSISQRGDLVFIDPSQNDYADTISAPYSLRPYHIPTVSTPLEWKEVNAKLDPHKFTMDKVRDRLKKHGDLFRDILSPVWHKQNAKGFMSLD